MKNIILLLISTISWSCQSQSATEELSPGYVRSVVDKIGEAFEEGYVFAEKGQKVKQQLSKNFDSGEYSGLQSHDELAQRIKEHIFDICEDKHVQVNYLGNKSGASYQEGSRGDDFMNSFKNFGFTKADVLKNNIGYIKLDIFYPIYNNRLAEQTASEAMQKMADTKALIFDLRECRGGSPDMLNYLISYLYPPNSNVHLNTFYYRPTDYTRNTYTHDRIKGKRLADTPVYVLTSGKTFSCGEEFSYDLKHLERATLIGEITGGGAHPIEPVKIDDNFEINLPMGRAINPITGTNWEGVGVIPHHEIPADLALNKVLELINKE
ncbi:S41 family peptidase [Fulvivirga lutea]|uniref:S41 family peptidase n=1 Tax=Fulvivirga lutea TaxID=2810512 RepID=A0A974WKZ3_9BACT|nr:S41 family peptidase [Fulvivirga lutea]QSE99137.1 S41 family peptidase [Fulvivirga lutea]